MSFLEPEPHDVYLNLHHTSCKYNLVITSLLKYYSSTAVDSAFLSLKVYNFPLCFVSISLTSEAGLIGISVSSAGDGLRVDSLGYQYQFNSSGSPCIQAEHSASHQEICSLNSTKRRAHANFSNQKESTY